MPNKKGAKARRTRGQRAFLVEMPTDLFNGIKALADRHERTVSAEIRAALRRHIDQPPHDLVESPYPQKENGA